MDFKSADFLKDKRDQAIEWARRILNLGDQVVILDTEATGLHWDAEVIQVAGVDLAGRVLFDHLCRPMFSIHEEAAAVHHITNDMVASCPFFNRFAYPNLLAVLLGKVVVTYNMAFDRRLLRQTCKLFELPEIEAEQWNCAMERYAEFVGEWNNYYRSFRWQKLPGGDHTAAGDCLATVALIRRMAECKMSKEVEEVRLANQ